MVLSGSLPPGLADGTYATLIETAAAAAVPAVLDTHGEALRRGAAAGPAIVKPNLAELAALAGPAASSALAPSADGRAGRRGGAAQLRGARPWWSRSARTGCWPRPGTAAGGPGRPPRWPGTRPARATRWPRPWPTGWSSAGRGTSGCGTRRRWAPRPPRPRSPGSSAAGLPRRAGRGHGGGGPLMPLATMGEIVGPARAAGRGVGAFNVIGIEHAEAIVAGAETAGAPVVLQISENCAAWHGALEPIARACLAVARAAAVPVAVHLDHASGAELVRRRSGSASGRSCTTRPGSRTRRTSGPPPRWPRGATTGASGSRRNSARSAARTACTRRGPDRSGRGGRLVAATGVDALAVAVGSSHAMLTGRGPRPRPDRPAPPGRRRPAGPARLVRRAGQDLAAAIRAGLTKINIATQLNKVFTAAVRDYLSAEPRWLIPGGTVRPDATRSRPR